MKEIKKILVATDFSEAAALAVREAERLAKQLHAELIVVHVFDAPPVVLPGDSAAAVVQFIDGQRSIAESNLRDLANRMKEHGLCVSARVEYGTPFEKINEVAAAEHVDLIVLGTHGRQGLKHMMLGSVAERVVRTAPAPVMTFRLHAAA